MPAPSTNDWESVKATAIALNSIKLAAEKHGVPYAAAKMRASREEWPVGQRPAKQAREAIAVAQAQLVKVSPGAVTAVTSTSDALKEVLADDSRETRISLSRAARNLAAKAEFAPLDQACDVLQVAKTAALVHSWEQAGGGTSINILIQ